MIDGFSMPAAVLGAVLFSLLGAYLTGVTLWKAPVIVAAAAVCSDLVGLFGTFGDDAILRVAETIALVLGAALMARLLRVPLRAAGIIMIGAFLGSLAFVVLAHYVLPR